MSSCYGCGKPTGPADAYARLTVGGDAYLLCCPMCVSAVEAGRVQRLLVPSSFSDQRVDVLVECVPALQVGGDYACIRFSPGGKLYLIVGDVSGHGLTSSILMSRLSAETERFVTEDAPLTSIARSLNGRMRSWVGDEDLYVTLFGSVVDFEARTLSYVNCGHPAQLRWSDHEGKLTRMESQNVPVGLFEDDVFGEVLERSFPIGASDRLMLFTDGLLELRDPDGEELGEDGVVRLFQGFVERAVEETMPDALGRLRSSWVSAVDDLLVVLVRLKAM